MSLPTFSQKDTETNLICISTEQVRAIAADLVSYDYCKQERDSLKAEITDLNSIIEQDSILLNTYETTTDSLVLLSEECYWQSVNLNLELEDKNSKIKSLRSTRTITLLTTVLGTLTPILLNKN
jgi:hypothetical protein